MRVGPAKAGTPYEKGHTRSQRLRIELDQKHEQVDSEDKKGKGERARCAFDHCAFDHVVTRQLVLLIAAQRGTSVTQRIIGNQDAA
jgi:hypothetical protein